jgi:hypothetical protein
MAAQVEIIGHRLEVRKDLGLISVGAGPTAVRRERERIEVALDIARRTRIGVLPPRAADAVGPLDDHDVVDTFAAQSDRCGKTAETGSDDGYPRRCPPAGQRSDATGEVSPLHRWMPVRISNPSGVPFARDAARMSAYSVGVP